MPGAHHIGRQLQALGHDVRLIPAQYVKPFLKGHKNDYRDAEAIAEAVQRPTMSFVAIKTPDQMDLLALHRVRSRLVGQRTGVTNQIRGLLLERGLCCINFVKTHPERPAPFGTHYTLGLTCQCNRAVGAETFARMVAFAISQPEDVDVNEILFRPTTQPV